MVASSKIAALGALLFNASAAVATLAPERNPEMRLIKTSLHDEGVWMHKREKLDLMARHIHFADITETRGIEEMRLHRISRRQNGTYDYPSKAEHVAEALPLLALCDQSNLVDRAKEMTDQYSRYYEGCWAKPAARWMYKAVAAAAASNEKITVEPWTHASYDQPSVIATIPGTTDKVVIVSAHYDSIGGSPTARAPGADDNASGIVTILEALRVLAVSGFEPTNTLEFHFYSGEEGGLLGSRDIMQAYADEGVNVIAMMNQDMTGYSPNNVIAVFTDYVDQGLTEFLMKLVPVYSSLPLSTDECGYACSDHGSAYEVGYPGAYVCDENMADASPYIHSPRDTYDTLDFAHILEHTKYTVGFLVEGAYF